MSSMADRLAIQSFCFRAFKQHSQVIQALKDCGTAALELCPMHYDVISESKHAEVLATYRNAGIEIPVIGVYGFGTDEEAARKVFEFAKLAGIPTISADFRPGGVALAEKLCSEYGIKIAIHNHGRKHHLGSLAALRSLFAETTPNIGLCLDTAWMLDSGEDPLAVAKEFRSRLYGVHVKDFEFDRAGRPVDVIVGSGNLDLVGLADFLVKTGYDGFLTLEFEGDVNDPVPATKRCVDAVRAAFAKVEAS